MKFKLVEKRKKNRKHQMGYFTTFLPDKEKGAEIFNNTVDYGKVDGNVEGGVTADGGNAVSESLENISDFIDKAEVILVDDAESFDINQWERDLQKEIDEEVEEETEEQTKEEKFVKYKIDGATLKKVIDKLRNSGFSTLDGVTSWKTKQFLKKNNLTLDDLQDVLRNIKEEDYKTNSIPSNKNEGYNEAVIFLKTAKIKELEPMRLYVKLDYDNIEETPVIIISVHRSVKVKEEFLDEKMVYHYGDLDIAKKAERRVSMSGDRGTGHFGTGFYAVSEIDPKGYQNRDVWEVDLDSYNLFKPKSEGEAYNLHDALKIINTDINFHVYDRDEMLDDFYQAEEESEESMENTESRKRRFTKLLKDKHVSQGYIDWIVEPILDGLWGYAERRMREYLDDVESMQEKFQWAIQTLNKIFGKDVRDKARDAMFSVDQDDSKSTVFMKSLGYEGIDVTDFKGLDNFKYGTVIYDLKDGTYEKVENKMSKKEALSVLEELEEEETGRCVWCGGSFPLSEMNKEKDMGYICDHCKEALQSRGEELEFEDEYDESLNESKDRDVKILGGMFEFVEGRHLPISSRIGKLLTIDEINKTLSSEHFYSKMYGDPGYDKCYVDIIVEVDGKKYRFHGARADLGGSSNDVEINQEDLDYVIDLYKNASEEDLGNPIE